MACAPIELSERSYRHNGRRYRSTTLANPDPTRTIGVKAPEGSDMGHRRILATGLALSATFCFALQSTQAVSGALGSGSVPHTSDAVSLRNAMELAPGPGPGTTYATNWSGYADTGGPFTHVSGSWVEPSVSCAKAKIGFSAFWVGIDGFSSPTVEQTGSEAVCIGAQTAYEAFYELYPAAAVVLDSSTYPVVPGDTLTASVAAGAGSMFTISLSSSRGWTFTTAGSAPSALESSAEWIAEAPSLCLLTQCSVLPLADFGTVDFTDASATSGGTAGPISTYPFQSIVMAKQKKKVTVTRAEPSPLSPDGTSFSDTWAHS
jgi:hypothetical protein